MTKPILYGNDAFVDNVLVLFPPSTWSYLARKCYDNNYKRANKGIEEIAVLNLYADDVPGYDPDGIPHLADALWHKRFVDRRIDRYIELGYLWIVFDGEWYHSTPKYPGPVTLYQRAMIIYRWYLTAKRCAAVGVKLGFTAFDRPEPNRAYDAAIYGASYSHTLHILTQATFAAGWNEPARARRARYGKRIRWHGGINIDRQDERWSKDRSLGRWPKFSLVWLYGMEGVNRNVEKTKRIIANLEAI